MPFIDSLINLAIAEDIGDGDHSSLSCIPADAVGTVQLKIKQQGVLAGIQIARQVYQRIDPEVNFESHMDDGVLVNVGDIPFTATGRVHSLLQAERIVLNIMQRMSGIAT